MYETEFLKIKKDEFFSDNSARMTVRPNQKYSIITTITGKKGVPYCAYFFVILHDSQEREIVRRIRWITDFSGRPTEYKILFSALHGTENAIVGYRINSETPVKSDVEINLPQLSLMDLKEESDDGIELFDDINEYEIPQLPPLSSQEEDTLEKKMVWIFSPPRSGTTWLGDRLLRHPDNAIWFEPWIGFHIGASFINEGSQTVDPQFDRVYDLQSKGGSYFFSPHHKKNWVPALRKFVLARTYSEVQTFTKNIIIKEPVGSHSADILLECLPNSKLIFLLRDGRDVVDSRIDMHGKNTWAKLRPLNTEESRYLAIKWYSFQWNKITERINRAYQNHNPDLRLLIRYEELRKDTVTELRKIYNFLQIKINDDDLAKIVSIYDFENISPSQKGQGKFNRTAMIGGWRISFSEKEQELMNSIMGDTLKQMAYQV